MKIWQNKQLRVAVILFHVVLIAYTGVVLYPLFTMLLGSVKTMKDLIVNPYGWPEVFQWSNYSRAWTEANFALFAKNSLWVTVAATCSILFCASMAAYVLGRFKFRLNAWVFGFFVAGMIVSGRLSIIPLFLLMRDLKLLNSHFGLILVYTANAMPFSIFLLTTFFRQIPHELEEAAVVEGAGPWTIYWRIMLPLVRPALATVAIFEFMGIWNDFFFPLIFLRSEKLMTIPVGLSVFFGEYATDWATLFAALTISVVPVIVAFIVASRQFIAGLTAGAIK